MRIDAFAPIETFANSDEIDQITGWCMATFDADDYRLMACRTSGSVIFHSIHPQILTYFRMRWC